MAFRQAKASGEDSYCKNRIACSARKYGKGEWSGAMGLGQQAARDHRLRVAMMKQGRLIPATLHPDFEKSNSGLRDARSAVGAEAAGFHNEAPARFRHPFELFAYMEALKRDALSAGRRITGPIRLDPDHEDAELIDETTFIAAWREEW